MNALADLEIAILEEDEKGVSGYLSEIDRRTAAEAFRKAAADFGFKTVEIGGTVFAHVARASKVLGYADPTGLAKLLDRYQIQTPKIGWHGQNVRANIRKAFNLNPNDSQATLLSWEGFLLVGMCGVSKEAHKVKSYLLKCEREARVLREVSSKEAIDLELAKIKRLEAVTKAVTAAEKVSGAEYRRFIDDELKALTGKRLPEPKQPKLKLVEKDEE